MSKFLNFEWGAGEQKARFNVRIGALHLELNLPLRYSGVQRLTWHQQAQNEREEALSGQIEPIDAEPPPAARR